MYDRFARLCPCLLAAVLQSPLRGAGQQELQSRPQSAPEAPMTFEEKWNQPDARSGVAADPVTGDVYAITGEVGFPDHAECHIERFDRSGKRLGDFKITTTGHEGLNHSLRLANLVGDRAPEFVIFEEWGAPVWAYDGKGKLLWEHAPGDGVDDVWIADLDGKNGDGHDQVIIGHNGGTGIHVLNSDGSLRWKNTRFGNVWHITAGPTGGAGAQEVFSGSTWGPVHVYDRDGKFLRDVDVGGKPYMVRLGRIGADAEPILVTAGDNNPGVTGTTLAGKQVWYSKFPPGRTDIEDVMPAIDRPWVAVAMRADRVLVYDTGNGALLANIMITGGATQMAWLPAEGGGPPLLIVGTLRGLRAGILREQHPAPAVTPKP